MIEVCIKYVYGDYTIHWEDQEYHDLRVQYFKHRFTSLIEDYKAQTIRPLTVECEYYPATGKFKIVDYSKEHEVRINYTIRMNEDFFKEYLK